MKPEVYIIVAADEKGGIGKSGKLPWHFKKEIQFFAKTTKETKNPDSRNMVVMGRKTWESIDQKYRPLPSRINVILSRQEDLEIPGAHVVPSINKALELAEQLENRIENIFVIGGGEVFRQIVENPLLDGIYFTNIHSTFECDTFFPSIPSDFTKHHLGSDEENNIKFDYLLYKRA